MAPLPNEVWLDIFALLDYRSLKKCMRVSKQFKAYTDHSSLDGTLFRDKVLREETEIDVNTLKLHPAFRAMSYDCGYNVNDIELAVHYGPCVDRSVVHHRDDITGCDLKFLKLKNLSIANEYATSPTVGVVKVQFMDEGVFLVKNPYGVTVMDVMEELCMYCGILDYELQNTFGEDVCGDLIYETFQETLGEQRCFEGFAGAATDKMGALILVIDHLGALHRDWSVVEYGT